MIDAALAHVESDGYETLTMRKLAKALQVTPMAIYRHVEDKRDLLSLVADRYFRGLQVPTQTADWHRYLEDWFTALHALMLNHPVLAHVFADQPLEGAAAWEAADHVIEVLVEHEVAPEAAGELFATLLTYTIGFSLVRLGRPVDADGAAVQRSAASPRTDFPYLTSALGGYTAWLSTASFQQAVRGFIQVWETRPR